MNRKWERRSWVRKQWLEEAAGRLTQLVWISFAVFLLTPAPSVATQTLLPAAPAPGKPVILILGDSISAEYGLPRGSGWVKLLEARLRQERFDYSVVNASISGETTSGGWSRLPALLQQHKPALVILELGANDGLRGLVIQATETNLSRMIEAAQTASTEVLLIGMKIPPNYGKVFAEQFAGLFPKLASRYKIALLPFFYEGFGDRMEAFQADRIHPNQQSQSLLLDNMWPKLKPLLHTKRR